MLLETRVLQDTDPDLAVLLAEGFEVVGESWAAELRLDRRPDSAGTLARLRRFVADARVRGLEVRELGGRDAAAIGALERASDGDPALSPAARAATTTGEVRAWAARDSRAFGVIEGRELVALCVGRGGHNDAVAVARSHRRAGLGEAVVAAWVLAAVAHGESRFTAGGAAATADGLACLSAVGFRVDERWLSLRRR